MITKYALFLTGSLLACVGIYFLRRLAIPAFSGITVMHIFKFIQQPDLWIGTFFYGGAFLVFILILNRYEASSAVPALLGTYLITVSLFSVVAFSEALTASKLAAYALIISGVVLLS